MRGSAQSEIAADPGRLSAKRVPIPSVETSAIGNCLTKIETAELRKGMHCVGLGESFHMSMAKSIIAVFFVAVFPTFVFTDKFGGSFT